MYEVLLLFFFLQPTTKRAQNLADSSIFSATQSYRMITLPEVEIASEEIPVILSIGSGNGRSCAVPG